MRLLLLLYSSWIQDPSHTFTHTSNFSFPQSITQPKTHRHQSSMTVPCTCSLPLTLPLLLHLCLIFHLYLYLQLYPNLHFLLSTTELSELRHITTHLLMLDDCKTAYKYALAFTHTKGDSIDWLRWNDLSSGKDRCHGSVLM